MSKANMDVFMMEGVNIKEAWKQSRESVCIECACVCVRVCVLEADVSL